MKTVAISVADTIGIVIETAQLVQSKYREYVKGKETELIAKINLKWNLACKGKIAIKSPFELGSKPENFQFNIFELEQLQEVGDRDPEGETNIYYCEQIIHARNRLKDYRNYRLSSASGILGTFSTLGKAQDPIDVFLINMCALLFHGLSFDGGKDYSKQQALLEFMMQFLRELSVFEKESAPNFEQAHDYLKEALVYLEQMRKNKSAIRKLEGMLLACRNVSKSSLWLVIAVAQPTKDVLESVIDSDIKKISKDGTLRAQSVKKMVQLDKNNPFRERIIELAQLISDSKTTAPPQLVERVIESPEYSDKFLADYLRGHTGHPFIVQKLQKATSSVKNSSLIKQDNEAIKRRLAEFGYLITFSAQVNALYRMSSLVSQHARYRGELAFYIEDLNEQLFDKLYQLLKLAKATFNKCKNLLNHIADLGTITLKLDSCFKEKYAFLVKNIQEGLTQIEEQLTDFEKISKDPSKTKDAANEAEEQLKRFIKKSLPLYLAEPQQVEVIEESDNEDDIYNDSEGEAEDPKEKPSPSSSSPKDCPKEPKEEQISSPSPKIPAGSPVVNPQPKTSKQIDDEVEKDLAAIRAKAIQEWESKGIWAGRVLLGVAVGVAGKMVTDRLIPDGKKELKIASVAIKPIAQVAGVSLGVGLGVWVGKVGGYGGRFIGSKIGNSAAKLAEDAIRKAKQDSNSSSSSPTKS